MSAHHLLPFHAALMLVMALASPAALAEESATNNAASPAQTVAQAYNIDGWEQIERIDFTFNVQSPGRDEPVVRQWSWWPKQGKVRLNREGGPVELLLVRGSTMLREGQLLGEEGVRVHRHFINDSYWFLFPFQIVWSNPTVRSAGKAPFDLPIGDGKARKLIVQYPDEGGYTPGDAYDLYLDPQTQLIQQWVFRRGGKAEGSAMTWQKHRQLGPIIVSTDHWGAPNEQGERFHLWFTDVRADVAGQDEPATPQPLEP